MAEAQGLYVSGAFEEVEATLAPCLQPGRMSEDNQVKGYRLLALSALQQGQLIEAKLVALSLLNLQPEYQPDPVLDPPSYADLIHTVRSQLAVAGLAEPAAADTARIQPQVVGPAPIPLVTVRQPVVQSARPSARGRRSDRLELSYWSGDLAFTGDINRNDVLDDYLTSDGPRGGVQASYAPASWVAIGLGVEGAYIKQFPVQRRTYRQAGRRTEAIVGIATLDVRMRAWSNSLFSPYLSLGGSFITVRMDEENRLAGGPSAGLGLDLAPTRDISIFVEGAATMPIPRDAFDDSQERFGDLFSGFRAGLRTRVGR